MMDTDTDTKEAAERGAQNGLAKASWVFDGNTTLATYERFLEGFEEGDPEIMVAYSVSPLSGEWSGESISELLGDLIEDDPEGEDDICEAYEQAYQDAYWTELQRVAHLHAS